MSQYVDFLFIVGCGFSATATAYIVWDWRRGGDQIQNVCQLALGVFCLLAYMPASHYASLQSRIAELEARECWVLERAEGGGK